MLPDVRVRRQTADDKILIFHPDGQITKVLGSRLKGIGVPRTKWDRSMDYLIADWLQGDSELYVMDEIPDVIHAARQFLKTWNFAAGDPQPGHYRYEVSKRLKRKGLR